MATEPRWSSRMRAKASDASRPTAAGAGTQPMAGGRGRVSASVGREPLVESLPATPESHQGYYACRISPGLTGPFAKLDVL